MNMKTWGDLTTIRSAGNHHATASKKIDDIDCSTLPPSPSSLSTYINLH